MGSMGSTDQQLGHLLPQITPLQSSKGYSADVLKTGVYTVRLLPGNSRGELAAVGNLFEKLETLGNQSVLEAGKGKLAYVRDYVISREALKTRFQMMNQDN